MDTGLGMELDSKRVAGAAALTGVGLQPMGMLNSMESKATPPVEQLPVEQLAEQLELQTNVDTSADDHLQVHLPLNYNSLECGQAAID